LRLGVGRHAERDNFTSIWPKRAGETPVRALQKHDQIEKHPTTDSSGMEEKLSQTVESAVFYLRWGIESRIQALEPVALCADYSPGLSCHAPSAL
jgi:hypothetical protein